MKIEEAFDKINSFSSINYIIVTERIKIRLIIFLSRLLIDAKRNY